MVTIGNTKLPGVQTTVDSAASTNVNISAALEVGLVGQADLATGTALKNEVHDVRTPNNARKLFGDGSMLAEAVVDALIEGAYPVYAVAPEKIQVTGEDLSGLASNTGTLANAPVTEDESEVVFTINGSVLTTVKTYQDPDPQTPGTDEVYYNPVTGDFHIDDAVTVGNVGDDVDYYHFDYNTATDALFTAEADKLDVVGIINENDAVISHAHSKVLTEDDRYNFVNVISGADIHIPDTSAYVAEFDSSRIQQVYPTRTGDNSESVIGAYVGLRAALGINNSPIFKRLQSIKDLNYTLSRTDQENLVDALVVPLANESRGARIVEDLTCVDVSTNADEANMSQLLHRMIVDYVTEVTHAASERFIGQLHTDSARNALQRILVKEMKDLMGLQAITGFTVNVEKVDALTASVDVGIDTIDPLRNIVATVTAGQIENGTTA